MLLYKVLILFQVKKLYTNYEWTAKKFSSMTSQFHVYYINTSNSIQFRSPDYQIGLTNFQLPANQLISFDFFSEFIIWNNICSYNQKLLIKCTSMSIWEVEEVLKKI